MGERCRRSCGGRHFEAGRTTAAELSQIHDRDLDVISSALGAEPPVQPRVPDILSATSLVRLNESDITAWDLVRPLPDRPTTARRMGTEVHRLIEENSRGMSPFADETELDEPSKMTEPSRITELLDNWRESGYAERKIAELPSGEPMVELPFSLRFNGQIVRGRIDAVYERDEGGLEIVDFKTGARFEPPELDQLAIYAKALKANGLLTDSGSVKLTYLFLDGDAPVSRTLDPAEIP
jgi:DNA helicase-2/ATP-dependent DNA helicase PcrA